MEAGDEALVEGVQHAVQQVLHRACQGRAASVGVQVMHPKPVETEGVLITRPGKGKCVGSTDRHAFRTGKIQKAVSKHLARTEYIK